VNDLNPKFLLISGKGVENKVHVIDWYMISERIIHMLANFD
jgi:hypothetical protein